MNDLIERIKDNSYLTSFRQDDQLTDLFQRDASVMEEVRAGLAPAIDRAISEHVLGPTQARDAIYEYEAIKAASTKTVEEPEIIRRAREEGYFTKRNDDYDLVLAVLSAPAVKQAYSNDSVPSDVAHAAAELFINGVGLSESETSDLLAAYDRLRSNASRAEEIRAEIARLEAELKGLRL